MTAAEVSAAALTGTRAVVLRGLAVRALAFVGVLVLARLLSPEDLGMVAVGTTFLAVSALFADGGLGAALIRRPETPSREDLRALQGFQLALATVLTAVVCVVGSQFGTGGLVTAIMMLGLPLQTLQAPGAVMLDRRLLYGLRVRVEIAESVTYLLWGTGAVLLGFGVVGLATAAPARACVGLAVMARISPVGVVAPAIDAARTRALLGFGLRYQAGGALGLLRDQGTNLLVVALAGLSVLGLWSVAFRLVQAPVLLFESLWRVSFPAMSRLLNSGADAAPVIARALRVGAAGSGLILVPFAAVSPSAVVVLLGERWEEASVVLPFAAAALLVGGPLSIAAAGFLFAVGDARTVLIGSVLQSAVWLSVGAALLPVLGLTALGVAWVLATLVDVAVLGRALRKRLRVHPVRVLALPTSLGLVAGTAGWLLGSALPVTLWALLVAAAAAEVLLVCLLRVMAPRCAAELMDIVARVFPRRRSTARG